MSRPVYIFGHRNPDADAICAALAYADFKQRTAEGEFRAARCGNSNARIDAILDHVGVDLPEFVSDVTPRLRDCMSTEVISVRPDDTAARALELIDRHDFQLLPVTDPENVLRGVVSIFQLGQYFIPKTGAGRDIRRVDTSLSAIVRTLRAEVHHLEDPDRRETLWVRVGAMDLETFRRFHREGEIPVERAVVVVGDRRDIQEAAIALGTRLLVITGGLPVDPAVIEAARARGVGIVSSDADTATTAWAIRAATRVDSVMEPAPEGFAAGATVQEVRQRTARLGDAVFMVTEEGGRLEGVFTRRDILRSSETRIILVDHNELAQAVPGADQVRIVEVVDHHRMGDLRTDEPILFINRPVGSTCTIIADKYRAAGLVPDRSIAGVLMGGLVSDTLNLQSPTTQPLDAEILAWLEPMAGFSGERLAEIIFSSGSVVGSHEPDEVVGMDRKLYEDAGRRFAISQVEELGFEAFWERGSGLRSALSRSREAEGLDFAALLVTDVKSQDSLLMLEGPPEVIHGISYPIVADGPVFRLAGVVSRKKQLLPFLTGMLKRLVQDA